jgi:AcrR family transcriptional regulator
VAAGRASHEGGGPDAVTMLAVAERVGVRAPSLYKWVPNRGALIGAIAADAFDDLGRLLAPMSAADDLAIGLRAMADAYRAFAHAHPRAYELLFLDLPPESRPPAEHNARAAAPLLELTTRLVGPERALDAARLLAAFSHGFVSMELSGSFRLGGDVESAYRYGIDALITAITQGAEVDR